MRFSVAILAVILLPAGAFPQAAIPKDHNYDVVAYQILPEHSRSERCQLLCQAR